MKLALVVPGGVDRTGEVRVIPALLALIERLARKHEVHVFALQQEAQPGEWKLRGATVHNIGAGRTRRRALAAIRAEHRRAPFALVQAIFSGSCGLVAVAAAKLLGIASVVHIGGGELVSLPEIDYGGRRRWISRLRERLVLRAADAVTAASTPVIRSLHALGVRAQRVPLGVDLDAWSACAPRARASGPARLIHIASLNRVKDQPTLLRALTALEATGTEFNIDFVGIDTLQGETQRLADELRLADRVRFVGFKTQHELHAMLASADLLVMASRHETGPVVLLEAAVCGVPAIGTAVGHFVEWSPLAAFAVPVGDWNALAQALHAVLSDEERRLRLAHAAQQRAQREDADYTVRLFEELYAQIIAARD